MSSRIAGLDAAGFMPLPGESETAFIARAEGILTCHRDFDEMLEVKDKLTVFDFVEVSKEEKSPAEIMEQAGDVTWDLYRFRAPHVPGFFLSRSVGLLWGGCLIGDPDERFSLFLVRNSFRKKERWLFYRRTELFAHELCHSMRMELHESTLEEYFAYQTSPSRLRRYLGNCFIRDWDAVLFVIPALLLFAASLARDLLYPALWIMPFWISAFIYPLFLLLRNARSRSVVKRAGKKLDRFGISDVQAILFRCTREELLSLGSLADKDAFDRYASEMAQKELRWKIILERFINVEKETI